MKLYKISDNPNCIKSCDAKVSEKFICSHNNNTALIKKNLSATAFSDDKNLLFKI